MNNCIFCNNLNDNQIIADFENFILILDIDPIQVGHMLLVSKSHYMSIVEIPDIILNELILIEKKIVSILNDNSHIKNVSIIQNNGEIMDIGTHFHVHIIPRYINDGFWDDHKVKRQFLNVETIKNILKNC